MLRFFIFILLPILIVTTACGPAESSDAELPEEITTSQTVAQPSQPTVTVALVLIPTAVAEQAVLEQAMSKQPGVVIVTTALLNVRQKAGTDSPVIASLASGECVTAIARENGWYALRLADGRLGWSSADYLVSQSTCPPSPPVAETSVAQPVTGAAKAVVMAGILNVRAGPGETFRIVNQTGQQDCLSVVATQDGWFHVTHDTGIDGWVSQQFMELRESCPPVIQPVDTVNVAAFVAPAMASSDYQGTPFVPDATVIQDAYLFECFGSGDNELRFVTVNTPVQVLGIGAFVTPYPELGVGPFVKIRIWDGQYAWIAAEAVNADRNTLPSLTGQCENHDRIEWSAIVRPTPTEIIPTPTTYPSWMTASPRPQSSGCCKICRKGKACGNSCISVNYTCHKGPGCACNG